MRMIVLGAALVLALLVAVGTASAENKYVGVKKCTMCHDKVAKGDANAVWSKSEHAKAFTTLKSKEADEIAKKKGLKTAAAESPECLKCHVAGGGKAQGAVKEEGVTCESCHGPASGFLMIHNKKGNEEKAKAAGLVLDAENGKLCETCHNSESPTFKGFKFSEYWAKVKHELPKK